MKPHEAVDRLRQLEVEARTTRNSQNGFWVDGWVARVRDVVARSLGGEHDLVRKLDGRLHNQPEGRINAACPLIESAIYVLEIVENEPQPVDPASFDLELWENVTGLVAAGDWAKVPSSAATFLEHKVRVWSGGEAGLVGKGLFTYALGDAGPLRLGAIKGEWEGWRSLAVGFVQAVSNVDRHRIQDRPDLRQYAVGALGTASLLLVQIRKQHAETIAATESQ